MLLDAICSADFSKIAQTFAAPVTLYGAQVDLERCRMFINEGAQGASCLVLGGEEIQFDIPRVIIHEADYVAVVM